MVILPLVVFSQVNWKALEVGGTGSRYSLQFSNQSAISVDGVKMQDNTSKPSTVEFELRVVDATEKEKLAEIVFSKVDYNGMTEANNMVAKMMGIPSYIKFDKNLFNAKLFEKAKIDNVFVAPIFDVLIATVGSSMNFGLPPRPFENKLSWTITHHDTAYIKGQPVIVADDFIFNVTGFVDTLGYSCAIVKFSSTSTKLPSSTELLAIMEEVDMESQYNATVNGRMLVEKTTGQPIALKLLKKQKLKATLNGEIMEMDVQESAQVVIKAGNLAGYTKDVKQKLSDFYHFNNTRTTAESFGQKIKTNPHIDMIADFAWDELEMNDDGTVFWLSSEKTSGAVNIEGDTIVPFDDYKGPGFWDNPDYFENGYGVVKTRSSGYEIIKRNGQRIPIDKKYDTVGAFKEGRAKVKIDDKFGDLYGLIDSTGKEVVAPYFSSIEEFSGGMAVVSKDYKPGAIDLNGVILVPFNSHIMVSNLKPYGLSVFNKDTGQRSVITPYTKGKLEGPFDSVDNFENGYAKFRKNNKHGIIDSACVIVAQPLYDFIYRSENGTYIAQKDKAYGILDHKGEVVVPIEFEKIERTPDLTMFLVQKNGKQGVVKLGGAMAIPMEYDFVQYKSLGVWYVKQNRNYGFVNSKGEILLPLIYNSITCYNESQGFISATQGDTTYLIGNDFKVIRTLSADDHYLPCELQEGVTAWCGIDGKCGLRHINGNVILPYEYDAIRSFSNHAFIVQKGELTGIVNNVGKVVLPLEQMKIGEYSNSKTFVTFESRGRHGILDIFGNTIVEASFDEIEIGKNDVVYARLNEKIGIIRIKK